MPEQGVQKASTAPRETVKTFDSSSDDSSDDELRGLAAAAQKTKPKKSKVIRPLSRLGAYCSSHAFPSKAQSPNPFVDHPTSVIPNHVYSFSEKVFSKHYAAHGPGVFEHNKSYLMRVYPFGLRFSSSNADPTEFLPASAGGDSCDYLSGAAPRRAHRPIERTGARGAAP